MSTPGRGRGRKPIDRMAAVGQADPQQAIWQAALTLTEFDRKALGIEVYHMCGRSVSDDATLSYLRRLVAGGFLEVVREEPLRGAAVRKIYRVIADAPFEAPRLSKDGKEVTQGKGNENMWRTMRIMGEFDAKSLAIHATTEETQVTLVAAKSYCKHLYRAGYLVMTRPNQGSKTLACYKLLPSRYSGPMAPMVQRIKVVFDPNLNRVVMPENANADQ